MRNALAGPRALGILFLVPPISLCVNFNHLIGRCCTIQLCPKSPWVYSECILSPSLTLGIRGGQGETLVPPTAVAGGDEGFVFEFEASDNNNSG